MPMLWFFHLFSENVSFVHLVAILAMNTHGICSCAFQCWKPEVFIGVPLLWGALGSLRQWHPWWLSLLRTGCCRPLGKASRRVNAHLLSGCSAQTKPQLKIDLCLMWQAGIWLAKAHTCPLLHPVLGSCSAAREAVSATFNSLSRWHFSGATVHISCSCLERSSKQTLLNC